MLRWIVRGGALLLGLWLPLLLLAIGTGRLLGGEMIAFARTWPDALPHLYLMDPLRGLTARITHGEGYHTLPHWSPDGRWLAWLRGTHIASYALLDMATLTITSLNEGFPSGTTLAWSPDSATVLYEVVSASGGHQLVQQRIGASANEALPGMLGMHQSGASWSPDGRRFVYGYQPAAQLQQQMAVYDMRTQASRDLGAGRYPRWSPVRDEIAYVRLEAVPPQIVIRTADGQAATHTHVVTDELHLRPPAWSPDGRWLMFTQGIGTPSVMVMDARSGAVRTVWRGSAALRQAPVWVSATCAILEQITTPARQRSLVRLCLDGTELLLAPPTLQAADMMAAGRP